MRNLIQEYLIEFAAGIAATLLLVTAVALGLFSFYLYLMELFPPAVAAAVTACGALFLGMVAIFLGWIGSLVMRARSRGARRSVRRTRVADGGDALSSALAVAAADWIAGNAKLASFAGLLAGVVTGASPELRQAIMGMMRKSRES